MEKKTIITILIIVLIIIGIGFTVQNELKNKRIKVGDIYFTLPQDYHEGKLNKMGHINITNGNHSIFITSINKTNIDDYVHYYVSNMSKDNQTIKLSNFTIGQTFVYKTTNVKTGSNHYWFIEKNKLYTIYNWDNNPQMDNISKNLINSINQN